MSGRQAISQDRARRARAGALVLAGLLVAMSAFWIAPGAGAQLADADAQTAPQECPEPSPTDTLPPIDIDIEPSPTPTECDDDDDDGDGNGNGNGNGNKGNGDDDGGGGLPDRPDVPGGNGNKDNDGDDNNDGNNVDRTPDGDTKDGDHESTRKGSKKSDDADVATIPVDSDSRAGGYGGEHAIDGEFSTDKLQIIATRLRAEGLDEDKITELVYVPFIIGGPAAWTNTWGAPRYGPGPLVRTHEGQDVFCRYGDPVLATENGTIEFEDGGLGGKIARLHRKDGSYWYYAHLSGWNTKDFKDGDTVGTGDVIGYCGNSGNAITTPPHVHFGWYDADGSSRNPMGALVGWLEAAEERAGKAYKQITGESIGAMSEERSSRLFGDSFAPDISVLKVSSEALLAATASPGSSAFGLAEAALQSALADERTEDLASGGLEVVPEGAGDTDTTELGQLVEDFESSTPGPQAD